SPRILYNNAGILGEYTLTGTGTVVAMQASPSLVTPALGVATGTSLAIGGCTIGTNGLCITGKGSIAAGTLADGASVLALSGTMASPTTLSAIGLDLQYTGAGTSTGIGINAVNVDFLTDYTGTQ